ncbi:pentatricopeptide repeat-containing protein At1g06143 [Momordica charantia]|uniref:Pentatricopeptide repeat-containing protein At1g06143 n=1 Tax=Momordica charantia TaxID=3673 RepID=A0A6J1BWV2_MOMCH|nr:pentatricopeptide repeat-containing protein At1g06143 [Momordica charantia]XP_022134009.1 pentatricopeptide repeat-containing protein At1g06143 [Momordica charantia]XP_022134010.1 pentatricopeptide repeat-containing protein At1g06143 [Momordica charantia]XP_022134011.1 pentatricopeptide repeat-containing protein At1g06143 [Momordica charantia]XP_022134012.1 pentatricopeptide repeat-containing protein At1g06143 [Momordica charantia]XP_022134013.1 pentatricopeptide repeat-containing protein A
MLSAVTINALKQITRGISNSVHSPISRPLQQPEVPTFKRTLLDRIKNCFTISELDGVYASMIKTNAIQDCFLVNQFISASLTFDRVDYPVLAFTQMDNPNVFVYNAMIRGFVHCGHSIQALQCYVHMLESKVFPTSYTFSSLVKACTSLCAVELGRIIHGHIWKNGLESHVFVQTALIDFYSNLGKLCESRKVFDEMCERDAFAWTTMASALVRAGDMDSARKLFEEMPERNTATWNTMIDGYARLGNVESAEFLFNQMPARDIISWTTMITCYSQNKQYHEALAIYFDMRLNGISPDEVTMAAVISSCAHVGALELGKKIHHYVMSQGLNFDVYIGSALVDMYAKCGSLDRSLLVFFKLKYKNLYCWNAVIEGLAVHGYAEKALMMFVAMEREKIVPNGISFISLLSACTHAGLVEEGRRRFLSMTCDYGIRPEVEHYGCMVNMLSKAGLLDEALELIRSMKFAPNSIIWGALLNGCKLHGNLEIAKDAVQQLLILEPKNSGHFNLLVSMYAEEKHWMEVAYIRAMMKEQGVEKKYPGSSWIELDGRIHPFSASAESHPDSDKIYFILAELDAQLKLFGCIPEHSICSNTLVHTEEI